MNVSGRRIEKTTMSATRTKSPENRSSSDRRAGRGDRAGPRRSAGPSSACGSVPAAIVSAISRSPRPPRSRGSIGRASMTRRAARRGRRRRPSTTTRSATSTSSSPSVEHTRTPMPSAAAGEAWRTSPLRADVDALGGLVEHQHLRLEPEPLPEHDLLLVAAAEVEERGAGVGRAHVELVDPVTASPLRRLAAVRKPRRISERSSGRTTFSAHRNVVMAPLRPRSTCTVAMPAPQGGARVSCSQQRAADLDPPAVAVPRRRSAAATTSSRPHPRSPASPTISPCPTVRSSERRSMPARPRTWTAGLLCSTACVVSKLSMERPSMVRDELFVA